MKVTGEARSTQRKSRSIARFSAINLMWITLDSNPSLRLERSANTCVSYGTAQTYHRDWNNFVSPRPFLGCLTLKMKVLEPTVTSVTTYQSSGRSIPAGLKSYSTLLCARKVFWAKWPKAFSLFYNVLLSFLFYVRDQYCQTSPSSNFLPQNSMCFVVTSTESICQFKCHYHAALKCIWCQFLKYMYCSIFHHKSRSVNPYTNS